MIARRLDKGFYVRNADSRRSWGLGLLLIVATLGLMFAMGRQGESLDRSDPRERNRVDRGVRNILDLEFARTAERTEQIRTVWGDEGMRVARGNIAIDYFYLVAYGALLALAARRAAGWLEVHPSSGIRRLGRLGRFVTLVPIAAAALDAIENFAMLRMLAPSFSGETWPSLAARCAGIKFNLVYLTVAWVFVAAALSAPSTDLRPKTHLSPDL